MALDINRIIQAAAEAALENQAPRSGQQHDKQRKRKGLLTAPRALLVGAGVATAGRLLVRARGSNLIDSLQERLASFESEHFGSGDDEPDEDEFDDQEEYQEEPEGEYDEEEEPEGEYDEEEEPEGEYDEEDEPEGEYDEEDEPEGEYEEDEEPEGEYDEEEPEDDEAESKRDASRRTTAGSRRGRG